MFDASTLLTTSITVAAGISLLFAEPVEHAALSAAPAATSASVGYVLMPAKAVDGRLYMTAEINGTPISFIVDTGANATVLSASDARRAGVTAERQTRIRTAGEDAVAGVAKVESVTLGDVEIGERSLLIVPTVEESLLGMDFLNATEARFLKL